MQNVYGMRVPTRLVHGAHAQALVPLPVDGKVIIKKETSTVYLFRSDGYPLFAL